MPVTAMMGEQEPQRTGAILMETICNGTDGHDGTLSGHDALRLMGRAALAAASRHGNGKVTMTGADGLRFYQPVPVGQRLELSARIIHINGEAMTILVDGMLQLPAGGRRTLVLSGYFQMLVTDDAGRHR